MSEVVRQGEECSLHKRLPGVKFLERFPVIFQMPVLAVYVEIRHEIACRNAARADLDTDAGA